MSLFHPISLCSVLYKVISKVIANRSNMVLDICIDEAQGAFVPGRLILDTVLVAYELMHALKRKRTGKKGSFALKLDMSKAYDRVEWDFMEGMMLQMGFDTRWVELIIHCISLVSYFVMVNKEAIEVFIPSKGLRQGDPLSPYLFLIRTKCFSTLLKIAKQDGIMKRERESINDAPFL